MHDLFDSPISQTPYTKDLAASSRGRAKTETPDGAPFREVVAATGQREATRTSPETLQVASSDADSEEPTDGLPENKTPEATSLAQNESAIGSEADVAEEVPSGTKSDSGNGFTVFESRPIPETKPENSHQKRNQEGVPHGNASGGLIPDAAQPLVTGGEPGEPIDAPLGTIPPPRDARSDDQMPNGTSGKAELSPAVHHPEPRRIPSGEAAKSDDIAVSNSVRPVAADTHRIPTEKDDAIGTAAGFAGSKAQTTTSPATAEPDIAATWSGGTGSSPLSRQGLESAASIPTDTAPVNGPSGWERQAVSANRAILPPATEGAGSLQQAEPFRGPIGKETTSSSRTLIEPADRVEVSPQESKSPERIVKGQYPSNGPQIGRLHSNAGMGWIVAAQTPGMTLGEMPGHVQSAEFETDASPNHAQQAGHDLRGSSTPVHYSPTNGASIPAAYNMVSLQGLMATAKEQESIRTTNDTVSAMSGTSDGLADLGMSSLSPGSAMAEARASAPGTASPEHILRSAASQLVESARIGRDGSFDVRLDPEELGAVRISFTRTEAGLQVSVLVERPDSQELVRRHLDLLAEDLRSLGFGSVDVSLGSASQNNREGTPSGGGSAVLDAPSQARTEDPAPLVGTAGRSSTSGLDLRI